jgi:hypothetical protein
MVNFYFIRFFLHSSGSQHFNIVIVPLKKHLLLRNIFSIMTSENLKRLFLTLSV